MKKLLTATTALALAGGAAFAEITISGDAKLGVDYNSEPDAMVSKHSFKHEMGIDFSASGTTDGGLSFGGSAGFDTGAKKLNTGTVFVSGAFGKITIGGNDSADLLAGGIADVGLNDVGVDDVVEYFYGTTASQFRYDQSVGNIALAISAGTNPAGDATATAPGAKKNEYAIGMSFSASGATVGIGYDSRKTISVGLGYSAGQIAANAFYAKGSGLSYMHMGADGSDDPQVQGNEDDDGMFDSSVTGLGVDLSYTMGASTLTLVYAKADVDNIRPEWLSGATTPTFGSESFKGVGINIKHSLGGGADLIAGFGQVPQKAVASLDTSDIGQVLEGETPPDLSGDKSVASMGLSFKF